MGKIFLNGRHVVSEKNLLWTSLNRKLLSGLNFHTTHWHTNCKGRCFKLFMTSCPFKRRPLLLHFIHVDNILEQFIFLKSFYDANGLIQNTWSAGQLWINASSWYISEIYFHRCDIFFGISKSRKNFPATLICCNLGMSSQSKQHKVLPVIETIFY